jgi:hypothetical protein
MRPEIGMGRLIRCLGVVQPASIRTQLVTVRGSLPLHHCYGVPTLLLLLLLLGRYLGTLDSVIVIDTWRCVPVVKDWNQHKKTVQETHVARRHAHTN